MVSCLMVTRAKRVDMARRAIECYRQQTYKNRELVIVTDDTEPLVIADGVRGVMVPTGGTLGDLRNMSVARAQGEFIAQWDDDDWHHPDRLAMQLNHLRLREFDGCTLARWTIADARSNLVVHSGYRSRGWEGSLVARRWKVPAYPALVRGEDTPVVDSMKITMLDAPDLYVYNVHGGNAFLPEHYDRMFPQATKVLSGFESEAVLKVLR